MTPDDNVLMTRVEGGAPMGEFLRKNFWFPAILSERLVADGRPERVRLIGNNYVAWRSTDGRVGFFNEACPHRLVSLTLARNEDNALRCIFHGWKYSVTGETIEIPTEPRQAEKLCKHVPLKHYPAREAAGIVWVWLGGGDPAPFPEFEFTKLPDDQVFAVRQDVRYNWVQGIEGSMDSSHVLMHRSYLENLETVANAAMDAAPIYEFDQRASGFRYAAIRKLPDDMNYVRVNQFVAPWYSLICPDKIPDGERVCLMAVPIDDEKSVHWLIKYNRTQPLAPDHHLVPVVSERNPDANRSNWPPNPPGAADNYWGQSREAMANGHYTGFLDHLVTEDIAVTASQGPIADRANEFLNEGDRAIVAVRRVLLNAVKTYQKGETPSVSNHADIAYPSLRGTGDIMGSTADWRELTV